MIDSGSEATFISEGLLKLIKLPYEVIRAQVSGLNQTVSAESKKLCQFTIHSPNRPSLQINTIACVLPQLAGNLPSRPTPCLLQGKIRFQPFPREFRTHLTHPWINFAPSFWRWMIYQYKWQKNPI